MAAKKKNKGKYFTTSVIYSTVVSFVVFYFRPWQIILIWQKVKTRPAMKNNNEIPC